MTSSVDRLLAANEPHWASEAEVCRAYFRSSSRSAASDRRWLARQAAKELLDGVVARAVQLAGEADPARLVDVTAEMHEEAVHYAAFVHAYDRLRGPDDPPLDRASLVSWWGWSGNVALHELRRQHRDEHGRLGELASLVTEGGRAALFAEGAALAGGGGADDVIAEACAVVHADELRHMQAGAFDVAALDLSPDEWELVTAMTVEQSRQRVQMREEQFGG